MTIFNRTINTGRYIFVLQGFLLQEHHLTFDGGWSSICFTGERIRRKQKGLSYLYVLGLPLHTNEKLTSQVSFLYNNLLYILSYVALPPLSPILWGGGWTNSLRNDRRTNNTHTRVLLPSALFKSNGSFCPNYEYYYYNYFLKNHTFFASGKNVTFCCCLLLSIL